MTTVPARTERAPSDGVSPFLWGGIIAVLSALALIPLARVWELAPDLGHGWAAPILAAYLWWERWDARPGFDASKSPGMAGWLVLLVLVSCAVPLRLLLTPYPLWPVALILYMAVLVGLTLYLTGLCAGWVGVRWVAGPMTIFVGVLPWPGVIERVIILPLREGIASLVAEISNLAGHPALATGTSVKLAHGWVGIDEACGGIRSLQAAVTAALFFGVWLQLSWSRRIVLLLGGAMAAVVGNFGRVLFLSWCASGPDGMLDKWHDPAGWAALGFSLVATGVLGWWLRSEPASSASPLRTTGTLVLSRIKRPLLVWILLAIGTLSLSEIGSRWWFAQGAGSRLSAASPWTVNFPTHNPSYRSQLLSERAKEILRPDHFISGFWIKADGIERSANYIEWRTGQVARSAPFLHNPTICLPYAGCELVEELGIVKVHWGEQEIPFHTYVFRRMNKDLLVAFTIWDPSRGRPMESREVGWGGWWRAQWRDVVEARRHQPAQLLSYAIFGPGDAQQLSDELALLIVDSE